MSRSRKDEPYAPPLPSSRLLAEEAYEAMAFRLWGLACQAHHLADYLTAYGWVGQAAQIRSCAREMDIQARAMANLTEKPLPAAWAAEQTYWHERTKGPVRLSWY